MVIPYNIIVFNRKVISSLVIFFSLVLGSPVFAGGGPVSFEVSPNGPIRPGQEYIVRPTVSGSTPGSKCQKCTITIKFENPQSGDVINQSDSKTDDNGTMYAKVISQATGERIIYAEVVGLDGVTFQSSRYVLYYQYDPVPQGSITVQVTGQKSLGGNIRQVSLSWNSASDPVTYYVFAKPTNASYGVALAGTQSLTADININTTPDYYVKVDACNGYGRCIESPEVLINQMQPEVVTTPSPKPVVTTKPTATPKLTVISKKTDTSSQTATSSGNDKKVVDKVESNFAKPQEEQSILKQQFNKIISWFISIFHL